MNNRGQMGMGLLTGMMVAVMVFVMMSALLPTIIQMLGLSKGSDSANCNTLSTCVATGGVEPCYNSSKGPSDTITCSVLNFTPGMYVLAIVFAVIAGVISGRLSMGSPEPQQQYGGYPTYG